MKKFAETESVRAQQALSSANKLAHLNRDIFYVVGGFWKWADLY